MKGTRLLTETLEVLRDAEELLVTLPPLSPDHESVQLAVAKLRRAEASLHEQRDYSNRTLMQSLNTIAFARATIDKVRQNLRRHARDGRSGARASRSARRSGEPGSISVFLDLDTVLLAVHRGRYGPELGLQAGVADAIDRLSEVAERIVVVAHPPSDGDQPAFGTEQRLQELRAGLGARYERLVVATCPHDENDSCQCAKPGTGLVEQVLGPGHGNQGWYIGADQEGMVTGRGAGLRTIRIGPHTDDHLSAVHRPDHEARDLMDAANHILVEVLAAP